MIKDTILCSSEEKLDNLTDKGDNKAKEKFLKHLNSLLMNMELPFYIERTRKVFTSYWQYESLFSQVGNVKANIHFIQSQRTKIQNLDWAPMENRPTLGGKEKK